jgi:hypothetical protein
MSLFPHWNVAAVGSRPSNQPPRLADQRQLVTESSVADPTDGQRRSSPAVDPCISVFRRDQVAQVGVDILLQARSRRRPCTTRLRNCKIVRIVPEIGIILAIGWVERGQSEARYYELGLDHRDPAAGKGRRSREA